MKAKSQTRVIESLRILLSAALDYAGLCPPTSVEMATAVENFAIYKGCKWNWMLGQFVIPASRLSEFEKFLNPIRAERWPISTLVSSNFKEGLKSIVEFHLKAGERAHVESIEFKFGSSEEIYALTELLPIDAKVYIELASSRNLVDQIAVIRMAHLRAKFHIAGARAGMNPSLQQIARFIGTCASNGVAFKTSPGLHHPIRGVHPLTNKSRSPHAPMHGFINVLLAAASAKAGRMELQLPEILALRDGQALKFHKDGVTCLDSRLTNQQLQNTREQLAISFSCCSFEEPIQELDALGLL